ncbi:MAG: hypothetical protein JNG83_05170 [Opitutaceae bacterium]|nr:hypothetical protein [Opitutaceae bacterium]
MSPTAFPLSALMRMLAFLPAALSGTAGAEILVHHAPRIAGTVDGTIRMMTGEEVRLEGDAIILGDLIVPGRPRVRQKGRGQIGQWWEGTGSERPSDYTIQLNGSAHVRRLVIRTDGVALPEVSASEGKLGKLSMTLNRASAEIRDFSTVRNLIVSGQAGDVRVPPGHYGEFAVQGRNSLVLGIPGSVVPARYHFQELKASGPSRVSVRGPVEITVARGFTVEGTAGQAEHPDWLEVRVARGDVELGEDGRFYGRIVAPKSRVELQPGSRLIGGLICRHLQVERKARVVAHSPSPENLPPEVKLLLPVEENVAPADVALVAEANDPDGIISRVEFFAGTSLLGVLTAPPFRLIWQGVEEGVYLCSARAVDALGAATQSAVRSVVVTAGLPWLTHFEPADGYAPGLLSGQRGWSADGDTGVTASDSFRGTQSMLIPGARPALSVNRTLPSPTESGVWFLDFWVRPVAGKNVNEAMRFDAGAARWALVGEGDQAWWWVCEGAGSADAWRRTRARLPLDPYGRCLGWTRVTLRLDQDARRWDFFSEGVLGAAGLGFSTGPDISATRFSLRGDETQAAMLDDLYFGRENPLFADADTDGMEDEWEATHGLSPNSFDRDDDLDRDGLSNLQEFAWNTDPRVVDSDGDGLTDRMEIDLGLDPARVDTDADGLHDGWERRFGLNPRGDDARLDLDEDGRNNFLEFIEGTDPTDYFDARFPEIQTDQASNGRLDADHGLRVRVVDSRGNPLVRAPVSFHVQQGGHSLSESADGQARKSIAVRTGPDGVATVFVKQEGR